MSVESVRGGLLQTGHQDSFRIISRLIECLTSAEAVYVESCHVYSAGSTHGSVQIFSLVCLWFVCFLWCVSIVFVWWMCGVVCVVCLYLVCALCSVQYACGALPPR